MSLTGLSRSQIAREAGRGEIPGAERPDGVHFAFPDTDKLRHWAKWRGQVRGRKPRANKSTVHVTKDIEDGLAPAQSALVGVLVRKEGLAARLAAYSWMSNTVGTFYSMGDSQAAVARRAGVTRAAISYHVRQFERRLGVHVRGQSKRPSK